MPPGGVLSVQVELRPPDDGDIAGHLAFYASSAGPPPQAALSAVGATLGLVANPQSLHFGPATPGCASAARPIDLFDAGLDPIEVDRIDLVGDPSFELVTLKPQLVLGPGERTRIEVAHRGELGGLARLEIRARGTTTPLVVELSAPPSGSAEEHFTIPRSADVLFVIDTDPAIPGSEIGAAFPAFIAAAEAAGVDWRAGLVTADSLANGCPSPPSGLPETSTTSGACGYLSNAGDPSWRLLSADTQPSPSAAFAALAAALPVSLEPPTPFAAAYLALSNPLLTAWNAGLVRPDASLLLVFVSVEDDASPSPTDHWLSYFRSLKRDPNLFTAAVLTGAAAARLHELASLSGGAALNLSPSNLSLLGESLGGRRAILLSGAPVEDTLEVFVDGAPIAPAYFAFDAPAARIDLSPLVRPGPGSEVTVRYQPRCF